MLDWTLENLTAHDVARLRSIYEPLTESVRALIDATIRTEVGAETVAAAKAEIDAATARLRTEQLDGSYGVRFTTDGDQMPWGNVVIGVRNPVAPPLVIEQSDGGGVFTDFHLGAAYEGPPGHVHGGVAALVLDHVLGAAASSQEKPRLTGTITLRYVRTTRLGNLHAEARIDAHRGREDLHRRPSRRRTGRHRRSRRLRTATASRSRPGRRGRMRAATFIRRFTSRGGIRSRAARLFTTIGAIAVSSGGSAISPNIRYIRARLVRSWVSHRSAISTRNAVPTPSEDNARISAWAAST